MDVKNVLNYCKTTAIVNHKTSEPVILQLQYSQQIKKLRIILERIRQLLVFYYSYNINSL